jgi:hypothetical protein
MVLAVHFSMQTVGHIWMQINRLAALTTAQLCGRLRVNHGRGPLIDMTNSQKGHLFFQRYEERERVSSIARKLQNAPTEQRMFMDIAEEVGRTVPQSFGYHYEYTKPAGAPQRITRRHASGGRIQTGFRPTLAIVNSLLSQESRVVIDGVEQFPWGGVQDAAIPGISAYLESF